MLRMIQIGIVVFVVVILVSLGLGTIDNEIVDVGDPGYDFELEDVQGNRYKLSDYKGQVVIINFFTSWCQPCVDEAPELEAFYDEYKDSVALFIVDRGESKGQVAKYIEKYDSSLIYLLDFDDKVSKKYKITGQPETIIIDKEGIIKEHITGVVTRDILTAKVQQYQ